MRFEIKESCCCGAVMEYREDVDKAHFSSIAYRQSSFHSAHQSCKSKITEKLEDKPDEK